jgi:hypothetical protein
MQTKNHAKKYSCFEPWTDLNFTLHTFADKINALDSMVIYCLDKCKFEKIWCSFSQHVLLQNFEIKTIRK